MKLGLLTFLILMTASFPLSAAEEIGISVKAEVSKATLTIGERVEYRVTVTHDPSVQILSKIVPPPSDALEVKESHDLSEKQGKQIVEGRQFVFTTYELGEFVLEPVTIRYRTAKGGEKSIATNRLYLTVRSVDSSNKPMTDIRDVKGALDLARQWKGLVVVSLLLLLSGGGAFFWWQWKHRASEQGKAQETLLSLEDETLLRLNRLFDSDLIHKGKLKEYFLELSEILRRYLERRFEILAVESTTSEVLSDLREKEIAPTLQEKIHQALETSDLVKFAKWRPAPAEILKTNQLAKTIVEEARPKVAV